MNVSRIFPSGDYLISKDGDAFTFKRRYSGYTRKEAIANFRADYREAKEEGF